MQDEHRYTHVTYGPTITVDKTAIADLLKVGIRDGIISQKQAKETPHAALGQLLAHSKWMQTLDIEGVDIVNHEVQV